jgi:hypothetical protein
MKDNLDSMIKNKNNLNIQNKGKWHLVKLYNNNLDLLSYDFKEFLVTLENA